MPPGIIRGHAFARRQAAADTLHPPLFDGTDLRSHDEHRTTEERRVDAIGAAGSRLPRRSPLAFRNADRCFPPFFPLTLV